EIERCFAHHFPLIQPLPFAAGLLLLAELAPVLAAALVLVRLLSAIECSALSFRPCVDPKRTQDLNLAKHRVAGAPFRSGAEHWQGGRLPWRSAPGEKSKTLDQQKQLMLRTRCSAPKCSR